MTIYQHFRPEEKEFIDQVYDWLDDVEKTYAPKLTDFLDPREQLIVGAVIGKQSEVKFEFFGGTDHAERKRALLFPDYYEVSPDDFQIKLFEIVYPDKFISLEHPQILGSLMSAGLKRSKYGDILLENGRAQFFAAAEIGEYLRLQLVSIGRTDVRLKEVPLADAVTSSDSWTEIPATVSSLRIDAIAASLYKLSRQKSQLLIQQGVVKVNWAVVENPAFECGEGDILSVRGHGRIKILSIEGKTKKDRWRIVAGRQK